MEFRASDIATVPNAVSTAGLALVAAGIEQIDKPEGVAMITAGRMLDLVDGKVARATGRTSDFGATVDATADKVGMGLIIAAAWRKDAVPKPALAAMIAQNILNTLANGLDTHRHPNAGLRPTKAGKYAMGLQSLALGTYLAGNTLRDNHPNASKVLRGIGHAAAIVGVSVVGGRATYSYWRRALKPSTEKHTI